MALTKKETDMIAKGKARYITKVNALGGASAYYECGDKGGISVASCMKGLKKARKTEDWANTWEEVMKLVA